MRLRQMMNVFSVNVHFVPVNLEGMDRYFSYHYNVYAYYIISLFLVNFILFKIGSWEISVHEFVNFKSIQCRKFSRLIY